MEFEIGGFAYGIVKFAVCMLSIVKLRSSVDKVHSVAQTVNNSQSAVGKLENSDGTTGANSPKAA